MIETDALGELNLADLIDDAAQIPDGTIHPQRVIDLTVPAPRREIVIPDATVTLLEDYELYVC
jgi:hypothetical protein